MKIFLNKKEYQLSDWVSDFKHGYNQVRHLIDNKNCFIALNCFKPNISNSLYSKTADINSLTWEIIYTSEIFSQFGKVYNKIYTNPKYNYSQLDEAKRNIDYLLLKLDSLKVYL